MLRLWMRAPVTLSGLLDQELEDSFGEVVVLVKAIDKLFKVERVLRLQIIIRAIRPQWLSNAWYAKKVCEK